LVPGAEKEGRGAENLIISNAGTHFGIWPICPNEQFFIRDRNILYRISAGHV
jgi:hypothetical protein